MDAKRLAPRIRQSGLTRLSFAPKFASIAMLAATALLCAILPLSAGPQISESLDFKTYREHIEPIFLKQRASGVRCYDCHSALATRFKLEPLLIGNSNWTEGQSRQNFQVVSSLVTAGSPLNSRLLLHPLAPEAGGDPTHTGGKFWISQQDPEWQMLAAWVRGTGDRSAKQTAPLSTAPLSSESLDYDFFKSRVQPNFLTEHPGHSRCYACHELPGRIFHLQPLSVGRTDWTEEQSRANYLSAAQQVVPGDPYSSRLLIHPLAPEAGGDAFHSGGRQFASQNDPAWIVMADWVRGARLSSPPQDSLAGKVLIYVTNSAGGSIHMVDSSSNRVTQVITGIELPHGIGFSADGSRIFVSDEAESVLDVIDRKAGQIIYKVPLSGRPNNITVTSDGSRVLVGIRAEPGRVDVIDIATLRRTKSIDVDGSVHNIYVTPDGKYAIAGSIENKAVTVIDLSAERAIWEVKFDQGVRPMAIETNPNGSTSRIFVQLSNVNGFAVVDFTKRMEIRRIKLPDQPGGFGIVEGRTGTPSHGIGIAPDGRSLWVNSTAANAVFKYLLPQLQLAGSVPLPLVHPLGRPASGAVPEWITFTPDSRFLYISNSGADSVSVVDTAAMKLITEIPVGEVPKRLNALTLEPSGVPAK
jgi:YVTN family beta-propeller protein